MHKFSQKDTHMCVHTPYTQQVCARVHLCTHNVHTRTLTPPHSQNPKKGVNFWRMELGRKRVILVLQISRVLLVLRVVLVLLVILVRGLERGIFMLPLSSPAHLYPLSKPLTNNTSETRKISITIFISFTRFTHFLPSSFVRYADIIFSNFS